MSEQLEWLNVQVPKSLKDAIREQAAEKFTNLSSVVRQALAAWFLPDQETLNKSRTLTDTREGYDAGGEGK
jgi:Arc/MetJ-type ribon-helix-helix transcriptional regulator